ncbi:tyrosine-type recombinase/integrase [Streptomyces sp. NPDC048637]|uniref:tyrosine-type recombinase/integrase n=1 Tax=Streptomyces sp. NPDC048637 TaxID=3155636 RepID=UPI00342874A9
MPRRITPNVSYATATFVQQRSAQTSSRQVRYGFVSLLRRFETSVRDCKMGSVKAHHLEDFWYGEGGLSDTCQSQTLGKYRNEMKQFLGFAHRREWCPVSPDVLLDGIRERSTRVNRNRYRMTRAELRQLLAEATDPRDVALVCFVACTGVRISEALAMRVRDVSFSKSELYVTIPKTHEEITYPLSSDLESALRGWLTAYSAQVGPLKRTYYLFPAFHGRRFAKGGGMTPAGLYNMVQPIQQPRLILAPIAERAGLELEEGDGWHTVRRSFARILYDQCVSMGHDAALRVVQAALNHKSVQTTERYLGLDFERQQFHKIMKGQPFLTLDVDGGGKIVPLDERRAGRG